MQTGSCSRGPVISLGSSDKELTRCNTHTQAFPGQATLTGGISVCAEYEWHVSAPQDWSIHEEPEALPCYSHWAVILIKAFFFFFFFFPHTERHMKSFLSSPTRDLTYTPSIESVES